jgi:DNA gyrase inhibitor GyrI
MWPNLRAVGIYYDDPASDPEEHLRSRAGVIVDEDFVIEASLQAMEITPGALCYLAI